jgi:1-acyl-sn-glycerol-3-phosphate acyltransferase
MIKRLRIHPVLWLIYQFLKGLSWVCIHIYYRKRVVIGQEYTKADGPVILISNHPSTLMDPLNVGINFPRVLFFLANYGLFKHPVSNWLLSRLYCIPIKRREDVSEGEERNNDAAFEQSFQHLEKGGVLYIAPEGNSWMERKVRPFKMGTAYIAFHTEARNNFELGLKIIPVGVTYYAPEKFRSNMVIQFGAPVVVKDFVEDWHKNPKESVNTLTKYLEQQVKNLCIHTENEAEEAFLQRLEKLSNLSQPLPLKASFQRSQSWRNTLLKDDALCDETADYFGALTEADVTDRSIVEATQPGVLLKNALSLVFLILFFPLFAIGWLFWLLPCWLPAALARKLKLYVGYDSNVKILAGIFTFSAAWWLLCRLGTAWFPNAGWRVLALIPASILLGYFTEKYWEIAVRFFNRLKALRLPKAQRTHLKELRTELETGTAF